LRVSSRLLNGLAFLSLLVASCFVFAPALAADTNAWRDWASVAWRYYQPGVGVETNSGLHRGTLDWHYITDWDVGSYISAIIDAEALGIIQKSGTWGADYRLDKVLVFLENRPLRSEDGLPYWAYQSANGLPATDQSRLVTDGADAARLLVSLDRVRKSHPDLTGQVDAIVDRMRGAYQRSFIKNGGVGSGGFYAYYYALGYDAFGFDVSVTLREMQRLSGLTQLNVYGQLLPPTDVTSEPIILAMLELSDRVDPLFADYALRIYKAQEERYNLTGALTAWSEGATDISPYYQYEWIVHTTGEQSPKLWKIVGPSQSDIDSGQSLVVYAKVAFAFHALYSTAYTMTLIQKLLDTTQSNSGFREGMKERTGEPVGSCSIWGCWPMQDKTNSIIIEAARYASITVPEFRFPQLLILVLFLAVPLALRRRPTTVQRAQK